MYLQLCNTRGSVHFCVQEHVPSLIFTQTGIQIIQIITFQVLILLAILSDYYWQFVCGVMCLFNKFEGDVALCVQVRRLGRGF